MFISFTNTQGYFDVKTLKISSKAGLKARRKYSLIEASHLGGNYFFSNRFRKRVSTQFWRFKRPAKIDFILNSRNYAYFKAEDTNI